jgi:enamine deaminase RidA (YjgF/YER057c/UK114 family)
MTPAARGQQPAARPRTGRRSGAQRKGIYPSNVKAADAFYSPAILAQGRQTLFISGQGPDDYDADMETQIRQTLEKIGILLEEAGGSWGNVVIVRSFFVHLLRDLAAFRKVRQEFYVKPYPASTAVGTPELAIPGLEVEIEAVAVL